MLFYSFMLYIQEHKMEVDKLKEMMRQQENDLRQLREDRMQHVRQQKESTLSLDRTERTLINEINDECRKTSELLGLSPRKVNVSRWENRQYHLNLFLSPLLKTFWVG